jgi:hypothetical protein
MHMMPSAIVNSAGDRTQPNHEYDYQVRSPGCLRLWTMAAMIILPRSFGKSGFSSSKTLGETKRMSSGYGMNSR